MRRALLALLVLAACGRGAPEPVPVAEAPSFRDRAQLIASTTRGTAQDLTGEWVISQSYPGQPLAAPGTRVVVAPGAGGAVLWRFSGAAGDGEVATVTGLPGRFVPGAGGGPELWVLWVDDDFRTAAVGTPDGSIGWIMNRPGEASGDRTAAAREVLEWSGYDLGRLGSGA